MRRNTRATGSKAKARVTQGTKEKTIQAVATKNAKPTHLHAAEKSSSKNARSPEELLEGLLKSPTTHANNLPALLAVLSSPRSAAEPTTFKTGSLLTSVAAHLVERQYAEWGSDSHAVDADIDSDRNDVYRKWLVRQRETFVSVLLRLMTKLDDDAGEGVGAIQVAALRSLMELVRSVSDSNGLGSFDHALYERVLRAVCERDADVTGEVVGSVIDTYCGQYADVHYMTCKVLAMIAKEAAASMAEDDDDEEEGHGGEVRRKGGALATPSGMYCMRTVYDILLNITDAVAGFDDEALASWCGASEVGILVATNDGSTKRQRKRLRQDANEAVADMSGDIGGKGVVRGKWSSRKLRQRAVSDAWIEFLKSQVPADCYRSLLTRLHNTIIPALINPLLLSDFLTHALNRGGMDGMLALNGIFILVTQHGLEYPKFYQRLYGLLNADVFLSKHRVRFFQLADIFLASPMVPAYTAAAFAKKFARLGIRGSPATAIIAIAFIHNIIRRHPSCVQILNRPESMRAGGGSAEVWQGVDVYDEREEDPAESRALESSMWEISVFRNHADCTVAQFARTMLEKDMTNKVKTAEVDISEVLGTSYASLFDKEIKRRLKSVPTTVYAGTRSGVPQRLFGAGEDAGNGTDVPAPFPGFVLV